MMSKETLRDLAAPGLRLIDGALRHPSQYIDCTNNTTQTSGNCPSGFCGTITCEYTQLCNSNQVACIE